MLVDVELKPYRDPIASVIATVNGNSTEVVCLKKGLYQIGHFSFNMEMAVALTFEQEYPDFGSYPDCYGVCDSPDQFCSKFEELLEKDERNLVVSFTHVRKNPDNAGKGGGWRWHKWGPYFGTGEPAAEYLDDEEGFDDGIYVYHIYEVNRGKEDDDE